MADVGLMQEVADMQEVAEEPVMMPAVRLAVVVVVMLVVVASTGIRSWALSAVEVTTLQQLTNMSGVARASTAFKKLASLGRAIGAAFSSYPLPSSCRFC